MKAMLKKMVVAVALVASSPVMAADFHAATPLVSRQDQTRMERERQERERQARLERERQERERQARVERERQERERLARLERSRYGGGWLN
ncbi:hypothetical protein HJC22_02415 [Corallococcus exiguus]|uniref:hypothetical protein n=1 Tax=Corallococcus exiguus TaxID=83462 RepID=UPI001472473C|nr:hypothetical protein [Corallococcus exiguus]NNC14586.1 hypothetical protein [Corallococcus exiguus]